VLAGSVAVAPAGLEVEQHQEVLERGDAVAAGPEQHVDDVDVLVVLICGIELPEGRVVRVDEHHRGLAG
jgi:hypothetical protein